MLTKQLQPSAEGYGDFYVMSVFLYLTKKRRMMEAVFEQRYFFDKKKYVLTDKGVEIHRSSLTNSSQTFLTFEQIGFYKTFYKRSSKYWLIGTIFFLIGVIQSIVIFSKQGNIANLLFSFTMFAICCFGYISSTKKSYILSDMQKKNGMDFFTDPDTDQKLKEFVSAIKAKRDPFLLENYGQINKNLPYNVQYTQLLWLRNNGVISDEELQNKLNQLDQTLNSSGKVVGFTQNNSAPPTL